jgi:serine/threonine protein phosphatase PrpC
MTPPLELARISQQGDRRLNQDRGLILRKDDDILLVLGDGLGGHPRGEVAAQLLVDTCEHLFRNSAHPLDDPLGLLSQCLERAHTAIVRFGNSHQPAIAPRTTGVACLVQNGTAWWCHVGDSRLYLYRDGRLLAQTRDHTRQRPIGNSGEQRITITRCLGGTKPPPDLAEHGPVTLQPGDSLLLCSDGFWAQHDSNTLGQRLYQPGELSDNLATLVDEACRSAHPRSDNASVVALRWQPEADSPRALAR